MRNFFLILCLILPMIFTSCSNDEDSDNMTYNLLIVKWTIVNGNYSGGPTFSRDGRVLYRYIFSGPNIIDIYGDWTLSGDNLKIFWDNSDPGLEVYNTVLLEITETNLVWKVIEVNGDEREETFTKQ